MEQQEAPFDKAASFGTGDKARPERLPSGADLDDMIFYGQDWHPSER